MAQPYVPGLSGYLSQRRGAQQEEAFNLQSAGQVMGLQQALQQQEAAKQAQAQQAQVQQALQATGGDLEKAMQVLIQSGNVAGAAKLAPIVESRRKAAQGQSIGAGGLMKPDGTIVPPATRPQQFAPPELVRLQEYAASLPQGDPRRGPVEQRIKMLGERQGGVNVFSGSLTAGVDEQGNPVFVQPSGQPGVMPRVVPNVRPPPKADAEGGLTAEAAGKVAMSQQAIQAVNTAKGLIFDKQGDLNKGLLLSMSVPGTTGLPGNTNARIARSAMRNAVEAKLRLETGAAATADEISRTLDRFMPTIGDTKESAAFKMSELSKFFQMALDQTKGMKPTAPSAPKRLKFDAQGKPVQ
jgi:hypothetical protein